MDPRRKSRRSSILKTRNDGGSGDLNLENVGKDKTSSGNLTGIVPKRRVSFCHTNQVKEFENTNSSTDGSLSKTTDFNQTMCQDMNMSMSVLDITNDNPQDYEKTRCVEKDMSFDGENDATVNRSSQVKEIENTNSSTNIPLSKTIDYNQTMCNDMNMSVSDLDGPNDNPQDYEKTRCVEKDMSFDGENDATVNRSRLKPSKVKKLESRKSSTGIPLSKTMNYNQTICNDMNMSVSDLDGPNDNPQDYEKTRCVEKDMSFDGENDAAVNRSRLKPSKVKKRQSTKSSTEIPLSKTMNYNQTMCNDMNMSVSVLGVTNYNPQDYEKTCCVEKDMSFDGENDVMDNISRLKSSKVKKRESTKSSTDVPLSKTTDYTNHTMCNDMNMSVSILGVTNCNPQDYEKTRCVEKDMSFDGDGENDVMDNLSRLKLTKVKKRESTKSSTEIPLSKTMNYNQTMCNDMNMSVSELGVTKYNPVDYEKTRCVEKDMSFDGESDVMDNISRLKPSKVKEVESRKSSTGIPLSKTMDYNQTVCNDMNMSVSVLGVTNYNPQQDNEKTRCVDKEISFDGENDVMENLGRFKPSECKVNPTVSVKYTEVRECPGKPKVAPMVFNQPNPENFLNPFGNGKTVKRSAQQKEPQMKLSYGQFGSSKTPKRNKITSIVPPKPLQHQKVKMTNDANVQTSPMTAQFSSVQTSPMMAQFSSVQTSPMMAHFSSVQSSVTNQNKQVNHKSCEDDDDLSLVSNPKPKPPSPVQFSTVNLSVTSQVKQTVHKPREDVDDLSYASKPNPVPRTPEQSKSAQASVPNQIKQIIHKPCEDDDDLSFSSEQKPDAPTPEQSRCTQLSVTNQFEEERVLYKPCKDDNDLSFAAEAQPAPPTLEHFSPVQLHVPNQIKQVIPKPCEDDDDMSIVSEPKSAPNPAKCSPDQSSLPNQIKQVIPKPCEDDDDMSIVSEPKSAPIPTKCSPVPSFVPNQVKKVVQKPCEDVSGLSFLSETQSAPPTPALSSSVQSSVTNQIEQLIQKPCQDDNDLSFVSEPYPAPTPVSTQSNSVRSSLTNQTKQVIHKPCEDNNDLSVASERKLAKSSSVLSSVTNQIKQFVQKPCEDESGLSFLSETQSAPPTPPAVSISVHSSVTSKTKHAKQVIHKPCEKDVNELSLASKPKPVPTRAKSSSVQSSVIHKPCEDGLSSAIKPKPAPTPGFEALLEKLNEYATTPDLDIFQKWGFLRHTMDKLARIGDHEWQDVLSYEKIKAFLGQDYVKAVNIHRKRLSSTDPLYVGAMKFAAEMKKKGIPLA